MSGADVNFRSFPLWVASAAHARRRRTTPVSTRNFFSELKRRNVYKVGAAYLSRLAGHPGGHDRLPAFNAPNWVLKVLIISSRSASTSRSRGLGVRDHARSIQALGRRRATPTAFREKVSEARRDHGCRASCGVLLLFRKPTRLPRHRFAQFEIGMSSAAEKKSIAVLHSENMGGDAKMLPSLMASRTICSRVARIEELKGD
jgi:hypothetical protein